MYKSALTSVFNNIIRALFKIYVFSYICGSLDYSSKQSTFLLYNLALINAINILYTQFIFVQKCYLKKMVEENDDY